MRRFTVSGTGGGRFVGVFGKYVGAIVAGFGGQASALADAFDLHIVGVFSVGWVDAAKFGDYTNAARWIVPWIVAVGDRSDDHTDGFPSIASLVAAAIARSDRNFSSSANHL